MSHMDFADSQLPAMLDLMPEEVDRRLLTLIHRIAREMGSIVDKGSDMDTGAGFGCGDLYFTSGGVEYHMAVSENRAPN